MSSHVTVDRWQFTLTVMVHYVFPIITMGLALFIVWLETVALFGGPQRRLPALRKTSDERTDHHNAAHFWAKIFAVNFGFGVVTGIPLEFQFGTNWAGFSNFAGGVIGQTLAMEGYSPSSPSRSSSASSSGPATAWGRDCTGPRR
jgi:cytochrome d ubiquinol oxidase subunit I